MHHLANSPLTFPSRWNTLYQRIPFPLTSGGSPLGARGGRHCLGGLNFGEPSGEAAMAKGSKQIEAEHKQRMAERRKYLQENPEVYQRDFDEAFKKYLAREFPELDPQDCDNRFDPYLRKGFIENWPEEAQWLFLKYHLGSVWDPDGDEEPFPGAVQAARAIRGQNAKIYLKQIQKHSIINLPPHKVFGRFLIAEIDLSKPRAQIKADIMAIVDLHRKKVKISGSYRELVSPPEPRDKELSYT